MFLGAENRSVQGECRRVKKLENPLYFLFINFPSLPRLLLPPVLPFPLSFFSPSFLPLSSLLPSFLPLSLSMFRFLFSRFEEFTSAEAFVWASDLEAQMMKNLPAMKERPGSVPGSGRSPGEGNGNPLQYSCLKNSMD